MYLIIKWVMHWYFCNFFNHLIQHISCFLGLRTDLFFAYIQAIIFFLFFVLILLVWILKAIILKVCLTILTLFFKSASHFICPYNFAIFILFLASINMSPL